MAKLKSKPLLGQGRQIRFHPKVEKDLEEISIARGEEFACTVREAIRLGLPKLKRFVFDEAA